MNKTRILKILLSILLVGVVGLLAYGTYQKRLSVTMPVIDEKTLATEKTDEFDASSSEESEVIKPADNMQGLSEDDVADKMPNTDLDIDITPEGEVVHLTEEEIQYRLNHPEEEDDDFVITPE